MLSLKKLDNVYVKCIAIVAIAFLFSYLGPQIGFAAAPNTNTVTKKLTDGVKAFQTVLTGIVVVVGIAASLKIVVKHLPSIDDPHVKNEMWKSIGGVLAAVGAGAILVWALPWVYSLFK